MQHATLSVALLAALAAASPQAGNGGGSNEARVDALCRPPTGNSTSGTRPPCHVIGDIVYLCKANGSSPLALDAHAQCMCKGSFFADYLSCQNCLRTHGGSSPANVEHFSAVIGSVSRVLCSGTPTAEFNKIFESVGAAMPPATTGNTVTSDSGGGRTEVSVYATITYSQGPGRIEGSATAATTRETSSSGSTTSSRTRANDGGGGGGTAAGPATTATTSSPNGAVPTAGFRGVALGLAAGAIVAAL
ncbi:hypothetical protein RB595_009183 [Gaeumannomyces hyphopodioides]